jgi:RNA polymerase sigma-70 factor (ECF subfamily)
VDLDRLFAEHYDSVVWFFRRHGFTHQEALDLAQESFMRIHLGAEGFRGDSDVKTWIYVIAANVYRNEIRRRRALRRDAAEVSLDEPADAEDGRGSLERNAAAAASGRQLEQLAARDDLLRLRRLVPRLPPRMQQIFRLRMSQQRSYQEIASLMQVSVQTVKSQIHQARRRLEGMLEEGPGGEAGE